MQPAKSQTTPKIDIVPDEFIADAKLSTLKNKISDLLKPYQHTFSVRTEEKNGKITKVRIETEILL